METIETELLLADLQTIEKRIENQDKAVRYTHKHTHTHTHTDKFVSALARWFLTSLSTLTVL